MSKKTPRIFESNQDIIQNFNINLDINTNTQLLPSYHIFLIQTEKQFLVEKKTDKHLIGKWNV